MVFLVFLALALTFENAYSVTTTDPDTTYNGYSTSTI